MAEKDLLSGKKVLIVDDEPDVLATVEDLLDMCETSIATTFEEGKALMENQHFDIAVLDIMGVDGFTLLDIANEKKIIAVMLTAHAFTTEYTKKSFENGAAYFIPKEKMINIATYLNDILDAVEKGKSLWSTWLDRLSSYYAEKFGSHWMDKDINFWRKFKKNKK